MTAGGETHYADRAPSLWRAEITTAPMPNAEAEGLMAIINTRAGGLRTLLLYNHRSPYPASDPDGSIFGSAAPQVGTITDRVTVAFTGFPSGYDIARGTYFGIVFDTSRYYLGQFAEARTADGEGAVSSVSIWPPLPNMISTGAAVTVKKPPAKFRLVPGSAYPSQMGALHMSIRLTAEQTYAK